MRTSRTTIVVDTGVAEVTAPLELEAALERVSLALLLLLGDCCCCCCCWRHCEIVFAMPLRFNA